MALGKPVLLQLLARLAQGPGVPRPCARALARPRLACRANLAHAARADKAAEKKDSSAEGSGSTVDVDADEAQLQQDLKQLEQRLAAARGGGAGGGRRRSKLRR